MQQSFNLFEFLTSFKGVLCKPALTPYRTMAEDTLQSYYFVTPTNVFLKRDFGSVLRDGRAAVRKMGGLPYLIKNESKVDVESVAYKVEEAAMRQRIVEFQQEIDRFTGEIKSERNRRLGQRFGKAAHQE